MFSFADCGDQVGFHHGDMAGVLDVQEGFEPNHEVGRDLVLTSEGDNRPPAVRDELTVVLNIGHDFKHLLTGVAHYFLLAVDNAARATMAVVAKASKAATAVIVEVSANV